MLGLFNFDGKFMDAYAEDISKFHTINIYDLKDLPDLDGYFINLLPKNHPNKVILKNQISLIEKAKQEKKKLLIFDGFLSLTDKEIKWLKNSCIIFEPALLNQDRSIYLPHWLSFYDIKNDFERQYDIGFFGDGDLDTEIADRLFFSSAKKLPYKFITTKDCVYNEEIKRKCVEAGVEILDKPELVRMVMFLPNKFQINTGYMFNCQKWIMLKTPILFPTDMLYYSKFIPQISNKDDVEYWFKPKLVMAYIEQFKEDVKNHYPRMLLNNVIKKVKEYI